MRSSPVPGLEAAAFFATYENLREFDYQGCVGVTYRPVVTPTTMLNFVKLEPRSEVSRHQHAEEQIVYVIDGELDFALDGQRRLLGAGEMVIIPPWVWHGARTLDRPCLEVDVFNGPRMPLIEAVGGVEQLQQPLGPLERGN